VEARRFLEILDPNANAFTYQSFDDDKQRRKQREHDELAHILHGSLDEVSPELAALNADGAGIFVTVNETDGNGRKAKNIKRRRAVWCEADDAADRSFPLEPSMIVENSPGHFHYYFTCKDELSSEAFTGIMRCMVADYGSDKNATDTARVLRVPGFYHRKGSPFLVLIAQASGNSYSAAELVAAFQPKPKSTATYNANDGHTEARNGSANGHADERLEAEIREALSHIPAHDRDVWLTIGMALHDRWSGGSVGYELWTWWSKSAPAQFDPRDQERVWHSFKGKGVKVKTIFALAREHGADLSELACKYRPREGNGHDQSANGRASNTNERPLPLVRETPTAEPFPIPALGEELARNAKAISEIVLCPATMAANSVLSTVTLAAQAYVDVVLPIGNGDARPVSSYFVTVGVTGECKTACDKHAMGGVKDHEKALRETYEREWHVNERETWESERRQILGDKKLARSQKQQKLDELGPEPKAPLSPLMTMEDPPVSAW
jgi:hypothetical protein